MSLRNTESRRLSKHQTEYRPITEKNMGQVSVRRATTYSDRLPLQIEMLATNQEQYNSNPFLKAKLKAFLSHINTAKGTVQKQKQSQSKGQPVAFFSDERVTFKDMRAQQNTSNRQTVCQLSKKLETAKDNAIPTPTTKP